MDNGNTERKAKSLAIGRGNWMFCTSPRGAIALAIMYTLAETAKSNGADVFFPVVFDCRAGERWWVKLAVWSREYK